MEYSAPSRKWTGDKEDVETRDKFVAPFYLSWNTLLSLEPENQANWLLEFSRVSHELDVSLADRMLDTRDWRSLKVAALMVGFRDWKQYSPWMIGRIREVGDSHDSFAMGVGVALLAVPSASDELYEHVELGTDVKGWLLALSVLVELDRVNGTSYSQSHLSSNGPLARLIEESRSRYPNVPPPELLPVGASAQLLRDARKKYS